MTTGLIVSLRCVGHHRFALGYTCVYRYLLVRSCIPAYLLGGVYNRVLISEIPFVSAPDASRCNFLACTTMTLIGSLIRCCDWLDCVAGGPTIMSGRHTF